GRVEGQAIARRRLVEPQAPHDVGIGLAEAGDVTGERGIAGAEERLHAAHLAGDDAVVALERLARWWRAGGGSAEEDAVAVAGGVDARERALGRAGDRRAVGIVAAAVTGAAKAAGVVERHRAAHVRATAVEGLQLAALVAHEDAR